MTRYLDSHHPARTHTTRAQALIIDMCQSLRCQTRVLNRQKLLNHRITQLLSRP